MKPPTYMKTRHPRVIVGSLLLCFSLAFLPPDTTAAPPSEPNVLFIITDQQCADAMSCRMGKEFVNTPTMERLAQTGMLFTRALSPNPLCMPARNSMFTGHYPHETRVTQNNICEWARRLAGREQVLNCGEIGDPPPLERLPPLPANLAPPKNEPDGMTLMRRAYLNQAGEIDGLRPQMEGRMVRTERYKYCVFSRGQQRESLVDLQADPGETTDLATDLQYREILLRHREVLSRFGREQHDPLVTSLLADNVKPIPFSTDSLPMKALPKAKKKRQPQ